MGGESDLILSILDQIADGPCCWKAVRLAMGGNG